MKSGSHSLQLRIKLVTPFLGDTLRGGVNKFVTKTIQNGDKQEVFFMPQVSLWRWALTEALDAIGILHETNIDYIGLPVMLRCPTIRYYSKSMTLKSGKVVERRFECFNGGAELTIPLMLFNKLDSTSIVPERPMTVEELRKCFDIIGLNIGLSPWGHKHGYGRFVVLGLE